jgi:hypothetical protein
MKPQEPKYKESKIKKEDGKDGGGGERKRAKKRT